MRPSHSCSVSVTRPAFSTAWPVLRRPPVLKSPRLQASTSDMFENGLAEWCVQRSSTMTRRRTPIICLPTTHPRWRAGGPDNVAKMAQYIALLGEVEQRIVGCFRNGGGLPYNAFPRFHALRAEESREV